MILQRLKQFRFDWKLALLVSLFLPLTISLGMWQLDREQQKLEIISTYAARQQAAPIQVENVKRDADLQFTRVEFTGTANNQRIFLLDNRVYQGRPGYEVIQPVTTSNGETIFLNRGWLAQGQYRNQLPEIPELPDEQYFQATVYVPIGEQIVLSDDVMSNGWPKVVQIADVKEMAKASDINGRLFPYTVRIEEGIEGAFTRYWPVINLGPEMHRGYAVQWFAMSFMLLLMFAYYSTQKQKDDGKEAI